MACSLKSCDGASDNSGGARNKLLYGHGSDLPLTAVVEFDWKRWAARSCSLEPTSRIASLPITSITAVPLTSGSGFAVIVPGPVRSELNAGANFAQAVNADRGRLDLS